MPNKTPANKLAAWHKWAERNKQKRRFILDIQRKTYKAHPVRKECSISGCTVLGQRHHPDYSKPTEIVWLCRKHHEQLHHKDERKCEVEQCDRKHRARGFCIHHWNKWRKGVTLTEA